MWRIFGLRRGEPEQFYFRTRWRTETGRTKNFEVKLLKFLTSQDVFGKKLLTVLIRIQIRPTINWIPEKTFLENIRATNSIPGC